MARHDHAPREALAEAVCYIPRIAGAPARPMESRRMAQIAG